jgi:hypothetical protein
MDIFFEFEPARSLCGVALEQITPSTVGKLLLEPDEIEPNENNNFGEPSFTYHFNSLQLTLFFNIQNLLCIAVSNPSFKLFGEEVFKLREEELIALFAKNGFKDHELDKDWGEKQLVFSEAGVTVFFDNQKISEIFIDV